MKSCCHKYAVAVILASFLGCSKNTGNSTSIHSGSNTGQPGSNVTETNVDSSKASKKTVDPPNEFGFAKISFRDGEVYHEGIVDAQGNEIIPPSSRLLVNDITGTLALVQMARKFLFVPLDQGPVTADEMDDVNGFQFAEPYRCGLAMVSVDDVRFYIDSNFEKAFSMDFEFAESFHHDRAWVMTGDRHRIIDTQGNTVADLNFDQVSPQSPWCWQVIKIENDNYLSGFVDLNGKLITELIYDKVGYYDPAVKRILVHTDNHYGFLDEQAKVVIPLKYDDAEPFDRGKARVFLNGRSFFINPDGMEVPE